MISCGCESSRIVFATENELGRHDVRFARRHGENFDHARDGIAISAVASDQFLFVDDGAVAQSAVGAIAGLAAQLSRDDQPASFGLALGADGFVFEAQATFSDGARESATVEISAVVVDVRTEDSSRNSRTSDSAGEGQAPARPERDTAVPQSHVTIAALSVDAGQAAVSEGHILNSALPEGAGLAPADDDSYPLAAAAAAISAPLNAPKPVASIAQLADYLINGFWQAVGESAHRWGTSTITYNIEDLNAAEKFLAESALNAWHDVANLTFVRTTGTANITYTNSGSMQAYEYDYYNGSGIVSSAYINISSDWITTDGGAYDGKTGIDSYGYQTYIHETGHALGLGHQGNYNGSSTYSTGATYANDTWQYSIMSYFGQHNYAGSSYRYVITPQMADTYAAQQVYGAASTRTGDTVYGFNTNAGAVYNFALYSPATAFTIYDSGGGDTLDASGYSNGQTLDLRPGNFSSIGGLVNNIGIMAGTIIESAIGGNGNDVLIGNDAGNTLRGGGGVDTLTGGAGADTFVFTTGSTGIAVGSRDRITDFVPGADKIDLSAFDARPSTSGIIDLFEFLGTAAFNGIAGVLNYIYDSIRGVTVVQGDTNGDSASDFAIDLTGNLALTYDNFFGVYETTVVIETYGSTELTQIGSRYFLYDNGGTGPSLKLSGFDVVIGQLGTWRPISAEAISGGYRVAWKSAGDEYSVWGTDTNGNYATQVLGVSSGGSYSLQASETSFQQDLNGDGTIGLVLTTTVIETDGSIDLTQIGNLYYLFNGGSGPSLKNGGVDVVSGQYSVWSPIAAEAVSGGYQVAWKASGVDQYSVWGTDTNGNYATQVLGVSSGGSYSLQAIETNFQQDLNGDGTIGLVLTTTVIETDGSIDLTQIGDQYYLYNGGSGPSLKNGGIDVVTGQYGSWSPIAAEAVSGGYQVAWKLAGADQYSVWGTDANGNYATQVLGVVSGSDPQLEAIETTFQQDLNGDSSIGAALLEIAALSTVVDDPLASPHLHLNDYLIV